jgi:hypothetical protein
MKVPAAIWMLWEDCDMKRGDALERFEIALPSA